MKPDERDIICEQDYSPLSNAELVEAIERYAAIMHTAPLVDFDLEWITGPARALLARAEAAEGLAYERLEAALFAEQRATDAELRAEEAAAEANDAAKELIELKERFDAMESIAKYDQQQLIEMAARVAELEAQLAAQQWRPIDEPAPEGVIEVKMRCAVADDGGVYKIRTDIFVGWWTSADDSEWRPLPAPDAQEPTP